MADTIKLHKPVMIDGEEVRELSYDIEAITTEQFMEADARTASKAMLSGTPTAKVAELDSGFHFYLGVMAIRAANPSYTIEDIERVKGPDLVKIMRVGRNFMTSGVEGDEDEGSQDPEETGEPDMYLQERG